MLPLVASQLASLAHCCTFSAATSRAMHKLIEREAKPRAGSQLFKGGHGVIANHSQ